ncbi:hypothetical protein MRCP2_p3910 (plasmid) [Aquipseudomonas alcaligenes]|nr:hypothetical protein MRCP2_p3910 [Pseudomonas alcaligenes]
MQASLNGGRYGIAARANIEGAHGLAWGRDAAFFVWGGRLQRSAARHLQFLSKWKNWCMI